jgi:hypothetical protein
MFIQETMKTPIRKRKQEFQTNLVKNTMNFLPLNRLIIRVKVNGLNQIKKNL